MSDGPYRTLNMRQQWKRVLQRAYQRAFDSQDVTRSAPRWSATALGN
jgi:hypothetical protein